MTLKTQFKTIQGYTDTLNEISEIAFIGWLFDHFALLWQTFQRKKKQTHNCSHWFYFKCVAVSQRKVEVHLPKLEKNTNQIMRWKKIIKLSPKKSN